MMMRLKKSNLVFLVILLIAVACVPNSNLKLPDGLYIPPSHVYLALAPAETQQLQVATIQFHREHRSTSEPLIMQIELIGKTGKEFSVMDWDWLMGTATSQYTLYTLNLQIPELEVGRHSIRGLRLTDQEKQREYDVEWLIEVIPTTSGALEIGKQSSLTASGPELLLVVEVRNVSEQKATVEGLDLEVPSCHYSSSVVVTSSFNDNVEILGTGRMALEPGEMKAFHFTLTQPPGEDVPDYVMLRPLLQYTNTDGNSGQVFLRPVIYSLFPDTDEQIRKLAERGKPICIQGERLAP